MKTNSSVDHAVARMTDPIDTPEEMVTAGNKHIPAIKNSTVTAGVIEVQTAVTLWENENTSLEKSNKKVSDADQAAAQARIDQATVVRRWKMRAQGCINAVNVLADGSKDVVAGVSLDLATRNKSPLEKVPGGLQSVKVLTTGAATVSWKTHKNNHGYMVQYATDPDDPTTHSPPMHHTRGTFQLTNQSPGTKIAFRVAACDSRLPGGQTPYTDWVMTTVSV